MIKYIIKRLIYMIPIIIALTFVVFTILYFTPGDPTTSILGNQYSVEASEILKHELGLDKPLLIQFKNYIFNLFKGDFGTSYINGDPVLNQLKARFPNTLKIVTGAMLVCISLGVPIGILSGIKPYSLLSNITMVIGLLGVSLPVFWLGLLLILLFSVKLGWFPPNGIDGLSSLVLPSVCLGFNYMANIMRTTRSSMLEVTRQDYIRTAKAKGVSKRNVIMKHALKNAMMPTITVIGINIGALLGGVVLTETVFSIPGTGRLLIESINKRDTPSILGCLIVMAICVAITNLTVDLIYAYIDPRIKSQYSTGRK